MALAKMCIRDSSYTHNNDNNVIVSREYLSPEDHLLIIDDFLAKDVYKRQDHHSAVELRRRIDESVLSGTPERLILDFSGVTFMDSSGIGLIMGRWRLMQEQGGHLLVQGVPKSLRKVMKVSGLDKLGVLEEKEEVKQ